MSGCSNRIDPLVDHFWWGKMKELLLTGIVLFIFALVGLIILWRQKSRSEISSGKIIYQDLVTDGKVRKPLFDPETGLAGKPDLLLKKGEQIIPVEIKSSDIQNNPPETHIVQLMAYCLLTEKTFLIRPDYGILRYRNEEFSISYTIKREKDLMLLMDQIRMNGLKTEPHRSHCYKARCNACGYRTQCTERL